MLLRGSEFHTRAWGNMRPWLNAVATQLLVTTFALGASLSCSSSSDAQDASGGSAGAGGSSGGPGSGGSSGSSSDAGANQEGGASTDSGSSDATTKPDAASVDGYVTPGDVGNRVGPTSAPKQTLSGDQVIGKPGTVLEDATINGCIAVNADNVTLRNVTVNCSTNGYPIKTNTTSGFKIERSKIDCGGTTDKGMFFESSKDFSVDGVEITGCDDSFFIDGGLGNSVIKNSVFHSQAPASEAHTDGMQVGTFEVTTGTLTVTGNWWEYNRTGCCDNGVLFLSGQSKLTVILDTNYFDHDFGTYIIRCHTQASCEVRNNVLGGKPEGLFIYANGSKTSMASCNTLKDGSPIPTAWYDSLIQVNDAACP